MNVFPVPVAITNKPFLWLLFKSLQNALIASCWYVLFFDPVLQEDDPDESCKGGTEKWEVLKPSCSAGEIQIEAEGCKQNEKQSL